MLTLEVRHRGFTISHNDYLAVLMIDGVVDERLEAGASTPKDLHILDAFAYELGGLVLQSAPNWGRIQRLKQRIENLKCGAYKIFGFVDDCFYRVSWRSDFDKLIK